MKHWVLLGIVALGSVALAADEVEVRQFDGRWRWDANGDSGRMDVYFAETDEGVFEVAFRFSYMGEHVYRGSAEGSLDEGELSGKVYNEDETRSFYFRGRFRKGKLNGSHFETSDGGRRKTGSFSLRLPKEER